MRRADNTETALAIVSLMGSSDQIFTQLSMPDLPEGAVGLSAERAKGEQIAVVRLRMLAHARTAEYESAPPPQTMQHDMPCGTA